MEGTKKFKLALFTNPGNKGLTLILERKLDQYFDYDIIESAEQIDAMPTPTAYDACFVLLPPVKISQAPTMIAKLILKSPKLVWIHGMMAGIDVLLSDTLRQAKHITLTNGRGVFDESIAEFVLASVLYFAKSFDKFVQQKAEHRY